MRVRATSFGGKEAALEREASLLKSVFKDSSDDGVAWAELYDDPTDDGPPKLGTFGERLLDAIRKGEADLGTLVVPQVRPEDMQQVDVFVQTLIHELVNRVPEERLECEHVFAWSFEVADWPLLPPHREALEQYQGFQYDRATEGHRLTVSSIRRAAYLWIRDLQKQGRKKKEKPREDLDARMRAALGLLPKG